MKKLHLKALRELKNYSQLYMATKIGVSQSYYSKLENGHSKLTSDLLTKAINALNIESINSIFYTEDDILESIQQYQIKYADLEDKLKLIEDRHNYIENRFVK